MANIAAGVVDAVINAGWWVANANRVRDIVNRGMDIAEDRSKDCIKIFQNAVDSMLQKGGEIIGDWNYVTKCAGISVSAVCINHMVNKLSDGNCEEDYFTPKCFVKNSINVVATVVASASLINMLVGKNPALKQKCSDESNARNEETTKQRPIEEAYGLEDGMPYFQTKGKKSLSINYPLDVIMGVDGNKFFFNTPENLNSQNWGKTTVKTLVGENDFAEISIMEKAIEIKPRIPGDNLKILLKEFSCYKDSLSGRVKLKSLKFNISLKNEPKSVTVRIEKGIGEFWIDWKILKYSHEMRNMQ